MDASRVRGVVNKPLEPVIPRHKPPTSFLVQAAHRLIKRPIQTSPLYTVIPYEITKMMLAPIFRSKDLLKVCVLFQRAVKDLFFDEYYKELVNAKGMEAADEIRLDKRLNLLQKVDKLFKHFYDQNLVSLFNQRPESAALSADLVINERAVKITYLFEGVSPDNVLTVTVSPRNPANASDLNFKPLTFLPHEIRYFSRVRKLELPNNKITFISKCIGDLQKLTDLNLNSNRLTSLPDEIGCLVSLQYLNIEGNRLACLPSSLTRLTNLVKLYASNNQIVSLKNINFSFLPSLTHLMLENNELTQFPILRNALSIQEIWISKNMLTTIPDYIFDITTLKVVLLSYNQIIWTRAFENRRRSVANKVDFHISGNKGWMTLSG